MTNRSRPLVITLLFLSGFTGLVYEFAWSKRLSNLLGNTGQAHAIVLATFMGGLACGAWLFGRTADRAKRPLVVYGLLELGVGVYALLFPRVLDALASLYLAVAPGLSGVPKTTARLVLAAAALVIPTLLMGGTLPAMTRHVTERLGSARRELSLLYAVNSLGASVGCLLAGMVMVPTRGLLVSERTAAVANLLLGAVALAIGLRGAFAAPDLRADPAETEQPKRYGTAAVRAALIGTALAGFTAMLYEITWIRVLAVVIGGTSYAFTLILTAFIFGISLGSFWLSTRPDVDALRTFGRLQVALVVTVCLALPFYERLPYVFIHLNAMLRHGPQSWLVYQFLTFGFCGVVLIAPTFLLGASFPSAARVAMRAVDQVGGQLGTVYLWNTVGTVLGSLLGGLVLLPGIGLEGNFIVGLVCNLVAALVALQAANPAQSWPRRLVPALLGLLVIGAYAIATHGWALTVASSGRFREWNRSFPSFSAFKNEVRSRSTVRFYQDDVFASVLVGEQEGDRRYLRINGKVDGSNGSDIDTQILAAHLGVLTHPAEVKKVLLVGVGAGITAGSLLAHPIDRLDVVEISPAVIDGAKLFAPDNHDALSDPRCHVHVEDARTFLTLSKEEYDLIVSVPSNPWVSGVSGLFSQDFFRVARERLAPGGRIVQWIHTYESSVTMVKLVVRTLRDSFEHGTTWVGPDDLVLIASREPQTIDADVLRARFERDAVRKDLARIRIHEFTTVLARQVHTDAAQKAFGEDGPVNTDDHNLLEYGSPIAYFVAADVVVPDERRKLSRDGSELAFAKWLASNELTAAQARDLHGSLAWVHAPSDPLVRAIAERWLSLEPGDVEAATAVATAALAQGSATEARKVMAPFIEQGQREPALVTQWLNAKRAEARRESAPWRPVELESALALGKAVLAAHPGDDDLREAVEKLETFK